LGNCQLRQVRNDDTPAPPLDAPDHASERVAHLASDAFELCIADTLHRGRGVDRRDLDRAVTLQGSMTPM
jgi:hypothetical protein